MTSSSSPCGVETRSHSRKQTERNMSCRTRTERNECRDTDPAMAAGHTTTTRASGLVRVGLEEEGRKVGRDYREKRSTGRGQRAEVNGQRSTGRGQRAEVNGPRSLQCSVAKQRPRQAEHQADEHRSSPSERSATVSGTPRRLMLNTSRESLCSSEHQHRLHAAAAHRHLLLELKGGAAPPADSATPCKSRSARRQHLQTHTEASSDGEGSAWGSSAAPHNRLLVGGGLRSPTIHWWI